MDGRPIPVRVNTSPQALVSGSPVTFDACVAVPLTAGTHRLDSNPTVDGLLDTVEVTTGPRPAAAPARGTLRVVSQSPTRIRTQIRAPDGGYLIIGQSFSTGWRASAPNAAMGSAQTLNTLSGWTLPKTRRLDVVASYGPQTLWDVALAVTAGTLGVCVWLVSARRRKRGASP